MKCVVVFTCLVMSSMAIGRCYMKCIARNPFNGNCISKVKVCKTESPKKMIEKQASKLAISYKDNNPGGGYKDCVTVVAAGLAAYGAIKGGPLGAAIGTGTGIPAARLACRRVYQ